MVFIARNKVRMHDTDMAGLLYFARQYRFANDALEDFMESEGFPFDQLFHDVHYTFVVVHSEADYFAPLRVGDHLLVHVTVERIGTTSFTMNYHIYKTDNTPIGIAKTVHVTLNTKTRAKEPIPDQVRAKLEEHLLAP